MTHVTWLSPQARALEAEAEVAQLRQTSGELEARCAEDARQLEAAGWRGEELESR